KPDFRAGSHPFHPAVIEAAGCLPNLEVLPDLTSCRSRSGRWKSAAPAKVAKRNAPDRAWRVGPTTALSRRDGLSTSAALSHPASAAVSLARARAWGINPQARQGNPVGRVQRARVFPAFGIGVDPFGQCAC